MKKTFVWMSLMLFAFVSNVVAQTKEEAIRKTANERYEAAEVDLNALLAKEPSNGDLYAAAGDNYLYWGEMEKAEAMFRKGIDAAPTNPLNFAGLGRVAWINKNEAVAVAQFNQAVTIMTTRSNKVAKPTQQLAYIKMAEVYLQSEKKNLEKALEYINLAMNLDDKNPEVYVQLGEYYSERDGVNLSNAIQQFNTAIQKDPKYTRALLRKGMLYVKIKNWDEGLGYYNEAIAIDPTFAPAYREKAELLYKAQRYDDAVASYAKYLELNNNCRVQQRYASFVFLTKKYPEAIVELKKAQPCNTENLIMFRLLGYASYEVGDFAGGLEYMNTFFEKAVAKGRPALVGSDYSYKGKLLSKLGQDSLAIMSFQEGLAKDPEYKEGYGEIAAIYMKQKRFDKAAEFYKLKIQNATSVEPLDFYYLGTSSYYSKDFVTADSAFVKATPKYNDAIFWRGRVNNRMEANLDAPVGLGKPFFEQYIEKVGTDPKSIETNKKNLIESYSYLGFFHYTQKNFDCAKAAYSKVIELDPVNEKAKIALGDKDVAAAAGTCVLIAPKN